MPSDSNGVYSLPSGYQAVNGETIQPSQHNNPLEDIATGLSARFMRNGAAPMTGAMKLDDGSSSAPSLTLASLLTVGFYKIGSYLGMTGVLGGTPVGALADFAGTTAPPGWLFCYGQSLLRATYPDLYTAIGTTYGAADGTHFSLPDCRGRVSAGKDDMGGTSANRLTNADDGLNGDTLGATGGGETQSFVTANLPAYTPTGVVSKPTITVTGGNGATAGVVSGSAPPTTGATFGSAIAASLDSTPIFTGDAQGGSSQAFGIVQPTLILNKIIFTGVA